MLSVRSMGSFSLTTQGGVGDLSSDLVGMLGTLKVTGDVKERRFTSRAGWMERSARHDRRFAFRRCEWSRWGHPEQRRDGAIKIGHDIQGGVTDGSGLLEALAGNHESDSRRFLDR